MWRKPEAKPTSPTNAPAPATSTEKPKQAQQAGPQQSSAAPSASAFDKSPAVPEVPAKTGSTPAATTTPTPAAQAKGTPPATQIPASTPAATPQWSRPTEASTISAGLKIKGEITGTSDLTVDGETQGKIRLTNGRVTVGQNGRVTADIDAREIVVNGTVQGNLKASESVRLGVSGHVEGSILTPRIGIDDGARLRGNVEMVKPGETPNAERREQPQSARAASATGATVRQE